MLLVYTVGLPLFHVSVFKGVSVAALYVILSDKGKNKHTSWESISGLCRDLIRICVLCVFMSKYRADTETWPSLCTHARTHARTHTHTPLVYL